MISNVSFFIRWDVIKESFLTLFSRCVEDKLQFTVENDLPREFVYLSEPRGEMSDVTMTQTPASIDHYRGVIFCSMSSAQI